MIQTWGLSPDDGSPDPCVSHSLYKILHCQGFPRYFVFDLYSQPGWGRFFFFPFLTQNLRLGNNQMSQTVIAKDLLRIYLNGFIRKLKASKFCTFIDLFCVFFHPSSFDFVFKPYRTSGDCILLPGMFSQVSANCSRQQKKTDALLYRHNYVVLQIRIFCD